MRTLVLAVSLLFSGQVFAQGFDNLDNNDLEDVIEDFASLLSHTSVSGADGLGDVFGFEFGVIAGVADTPGVDRLSKEVDASSDISKLPHGGLYGAITFPMGITAEANILPEIDAEDGELSNISLGVKWTFSDLLDWPVDVAAKASLTDTEFSFVQAQPVDPTTVEFEQSIQSFGLVVSKSFVLLEPYVGINFLSSEGTLSASEAIFDSSLFKEEKSLSGNSMYGGVNINMLFFKIGAEVAKVFDNTKASIKTSFYF